jgi:hypothetical protein
MGRCIERSVEKTVEIKKKRRTIPIFPIERLVLLKESTFFVHVARMAKTKRFIKRSFDRSVLLAMPRSYQKGKTKRRADRMISARPYFI